MEVQANKIYFMNEIREKIDNIDQDILKLISERFSLLPDLLKHKIDNNLPVQDEIREKEVLKNRVDQALALGIDPDLIRILFENIIAESVRIQKESMENLKR